MAPEFGRPIHQLPLIPANVLKKHRVHEPLDTRFRSAARLLQALWREDQDLPIGSYVGEDGKRRKLGSRIAEGAGRGGGNFLTPEIAHTARREAAYREVKVDYDRSRLVSGRDRREPNRLARHLALLSGPRLRRADVPECLEHGRLCYPPYMPCRLTACSKSLHGQRFATPIGGTKRRRGQSRGGGGRLVVQIPGLNCLKFRQCGAKEIRSYPLLGAKSRWFAMLAGRNAPGALADKWNHLIDKESLKINALEHVLIENVEQRFLVSCCWRIFC